MIKSLFADSFAGLIPTLPISSRGGTSCSPLSKPWGQLGSPSSPKGNVSAEDAFGENSPSNGTKDSWRGSPCAVL